MSDITDTEGLGSVIDNEDALDLEIASNEDGLAELIDGNNTHGELQNNVVTGDLAVIRGGISQPEVVAKASSEWDQKSAIQTEVQRIYGDLRTQLAGLTVDAVRQQPDNTQSLVADMTAGMGVLDEMQSSPFATELAIIQRAAQVPLSQALRERGALNLAMRNDVVALLDEQSLGDKLLDFAGIMVPARSAIEWEDVKAGVNGDKQLSAYLTGDSIAGLVTSFQSLPVDRATAIWPALRDTIIKASGLTELNDPNVMLAASMLLAFMEPEGGSRAKGAVVADLVLEAVAAIPGAVKAVKGIRLKRQLAKVKSLQMGELPINPEPKARIAIAPNEVGFNPPTILNDISLQVSTQPTALRKAMESVMLSTGELAVKEHNIIKVLAKAGDSKEAARMNIAAMSDPQIAKAIGITSDDAVQNVMPFQTADWKPQVIAGLMPDAGKALNNFYRAAARQVTDVTTASRRLRVGATHEVDRVNQIKTFEQEIDRVGEDLLSDGYILDDIKITSQSDQAFTFQYTIRDTTSDGGGRNIQGRRSWKVGSMNSDYLATAEDLAKTSSSDIPFQSPTSWSLTKEGAATDFNDAAQEAILVSDLKTAVKSDMAELWTLANKGMDGRNLSVNQRKQANALDIEGDEFINPETMEQGKVFLPEELIAKGVDDPDVMTAYYQRRVLADALYQIQNAGVRREYELLGFNRSVIVRAGDETAQLFVKPYNDVNAARSALAGKSEFNIYDPSTGKVFSASQNHIDAVYDSGRQIVRSKEDWNISGNDLNRSGEYVEYVAVQRADLMPLPDQVTHYKYGYVPKVNENIAHVVQRVFNVNKAGDLKANTTEAMRAFMSRSDAELFRTRLVAEHAAKNNMTVEAADKLYALADGSKMSQIQKATNSMSSSKGLFRGTRAKDELLMGLEGKPLERLQPEELMGRWLDHVAGGATQNELRIGREKEWLNTVERMGIKVKGFDGTVLPNDDQGKALEKLRSQLRIWNSVPSRKESLWEASVQRTHDWILDGTRMLGASWDGIPAVMKQKRLPEKIAGGAKWASMHVMLGSMNPAQVIVQGSAATVALSLITDVNVAKNIIGRTARMAALDVPRTTSWRGTAYRALGLDGQDIPADLKEMYTAWERSGLREAVRNNADLEFISSTGLGVTKDVMRSAENVSLTFYRMGELTNRRISYAVSFDNWRIANPTKKLDDIAEQAILKDTNLFMMQMNGANRAWFQGGQGASAAQQMASVTTQFMQVMTKAVELGAKGELRGGFSRQQKARIALGQIAMYGTAGIPILSMLGTQVVAYMSDTMGDEANTPEGIDSLESAANTINQGAVGFFMKEIVGADIETTSRLSLLAGVSTTIGDLLTSDAKIWQTLMGPTSSVVERVGETARQISVLGESSAMFKAMEPMSPMLLSSRVGQEDMDKGTVMATLAFIGDAMLVIATTIPTSGRNVAKSQIMRQQNEIFNRKGSVTVREDFSFATEIMQAAGWQSTAEAEAFEIQNVVRDSKEHMTTNVETMLAIYHRYVFMHNLDPAYGRQVIRAKQIMEESFGGNHLLVEEFNSRLESRILQSNETSRDRALGQYFKHVLPEDVAAGYVTDIGGRVTLPFKSTSAPKQED